MTSESAQYDEDLYALKGRDLENFGFARVRDIAYDAVLSLWRYRKSQGWNQLKLATNLDRDPGWLSRYLRGPGNWTFRTFGAFVQGLEGDVEIIVRPVEEAAKGRRNYNPYSEYKLDVQTGSSGSSGNPASIKFLDTTSHAHAANSVVELR